MALTAEQTTQATQLSNGLPWIYPGASDTDFWGQYFSGSGPSLTPAEQASGISIGPMPTMSSPALMPAPAPQPQVLPGIGGTPMQPPAPGAPVQYQSELIRNLREASPGFGTNNPGVTMLANPANSKTVIDFKRAPPPAPFFPPGPPVGPPLPPAPAPTPAPPPPPSGGGEDGGGGRPVTPGPVIIGPGPSLPVDPVPGPAPAPAPDPDVPDYIDDLWPPVEEEPVETFPVPDPAPPDAVDLPPLPPEDEVATPFPVPDPAPPDVVDLPPLPPEDVQEIPDYTEDLWPPVEPDPEPQDPPQGEIVIEPIGGGDRDQIREADPVTAPEDPIDEWDWIDLLEPDLTPPAPETEPVPEPEPEPELQDPPQGEIVIEPIGGGERDQIREADQVTVPDDPVDEWEPVVLPEPDWEDLMGAPLPDPEGAPPPQYDEIPEGEIDVVAPGSSQPARDAIDQIGDITEVGDPLDELGDIDLEEVLLDVPPAPVFEGPGPDVGPPAPDDALTVPDYTDDLGTPIYDEIPQGEIEVRTGVTDAYQAARDALVNADTVTQVGDPLDELGDIDLLDTVIDPPDVPPSDAGGLVDQLPDDWDSFSETDKIDWFNQNDVSVDDLLAAGVPTSDVEWMLENGYAGGADGASDYIDDLGGAIDSVAGADTVDAVGSEADYTVDADYADDLGGAVDEIDTPDYTQDMWPAVDEVATPDYTQDMWPAIDDLTAQDTFEMMLFDLMAQELLTGGGGGGGGSNNFNIVSYE